MRILLIDPGLSARSGHNASVAEELDKALAARPDVRFEIAAAASVDAAAFADLRARILPAFRIGGYATLPPEALRTGEPIARIRACIDDELDALALDRCDLIVMHTVYPLHLDALARRADRLGAARVTGGLLLPPRFWGPQAAVAGWLGACLRDAVAALMARPGTLFYSETGRYDFGGGASTPTPVLLPPVARATQALMARLAARARPADAALRFGYFGSPFGSKGFELVAALAARGLPAGARLVARLPAGHDAMRERLAAAGPQVDATSRAMDNETYLREMADVDVVLAAYDPAHYGDKMSGIVPEAIALGRPVLLAEGCDALVDFLDRYAPGSFACCPYTVDGLASALALPRSAWSGIARAAAASAAAMRELKSVGRYLAIAGLAPPAPGASCADGGDGADADADAPVLVASEESP